MNPVNEIRFCKFCQERTVHYGADCSQCENTSDVESDINCENDYDSDFIVSDSE